MLSNRPVNEYMPTPTEIRQSTAEIRACWTEAERKERAGDRRGPSFIRQLPETDKTNP